MEKVAVVSYTLECGTITAGKRLENLKTHSTHVHLNIPNAGEAGRKKLSIVRTLKKHYFQRSQVFLYALVSQTYEWPLQNCCTNRFRVFLIVVTNHLTFKHSVSKNVQKVETHRVKGSKFIARQVLGSYPGSHAIFSPCIVFESLFARVAHKL